MQDNKQKNSDNSSRYLINERIREFCRFKNLIQADLERLGINKSTVHMVWKDKQLPGVEFIQKMALKFKSMNTYWLLTGEGAMLDDYEKQEDKTETGIFADKAYLKSQRKIDQLKDKLTNIQEKYIRLLEKLNEGEKNKKCG
ncbi:MAG: hypothetical protein AB7D05_08435 [Mangrovibacterium sp.]